MTTADGSTPEFVWKEIARGVDGPGVRSRHCFSYDKARKATILFGGIIWSQKILQSTTLPSDTWELKDRHWTQVRTSRRPASRHRGAMVYDQNRGVTVLFGGQGAMGGIRGDTWTYSDSEWRRVRTWFAARPAPRCGHSLAYDETLGEVILFGGINARDQPLGDTWAFNGHSWERIEGPAPPARRYAALAYDPQLEGCLLHGGAEDDDGHVLFGDEWLFRDRTWTQMDEEFETSPRDDQAMAFHKSAELMVMTEGLAGERGLLAREPDGWRSSEVAPLHPRHQCAPMVWDETLEGLVVHGGEVHHGGAQFDTTRVLQMVKN